MHGLPGNARGPGYFTLRRVATSFAVERRRGADRAAAAISRGFRRALLDLSQACVAEMSRTQADAGTTFETIVSISTTFEDVSPWRASRVLPGTIYQPYLYPSLLIKEL